MEGIWKFYLIKLLVKEIWLHEFEDFVANLRIKNPKKPQFNPFNLLSLHHNRVVIRFFFQNTRIRLIGDDVVAVVHRRHPRRHIHRRRPPLLPRQKPSQSKRLQKITPKSTFSGGPFSKNGGFQSHPIRFPRKKGGKCNEQY